MTMQNASAAAIGVPMTSSKLFRTKLCQTSRPKVRSAIQPNATEPTPAKDTPKIAIRIRRLLPMPSAGGSSRALRCSKLDSTTKTTCLLLLAVRLVDRHHLRQQGLQVLDARAGRRVGREKLGRSLATEALEVLPQLDRLARGVGLIGRDAETGEPCLEKNLLRHALCAMAGDRVRHLVADHRGQLVVVLGDLEQSGVHADLAARQSKRVRLIVLEHRELPVPFRVWADGRNP